MNYTPLPDALIKSVPIVLSEAPMSTGVGATLLSQKAVLVGIIVVLTLAIGTLLFSILKTNNIKPKPTTNFPTIAPAYESFPQITEIVDEPEFETVPTQGFEIVPTSALDQSSPEATITQKTKVGLPELPKAGISVPIFVIGFLSGFIILVGFIL